MQNITAYGNVAREFGGVIHYDSPEDGALVLRRGAFWYNKASQGGAVYADRNSIVAMSGVVGWKNYANVTGGFLHCEAC